MPKDPEVNGAGSTRSRRLHVRLPAAAAAELLAHAASAGLTVSATARQLIQLGLAAGSPEHSGAHEHARVALSALVAAEHAVLMVASVLPEGERRRRELGALAIQAAEDRLDALDGQAGDL